MVLAQPRRTPCQEQRRHNHTKITIFADIWNPALHFSLFLIGFPDTFCHSEPRLLTCHSEPRRGVRISQRPKILTSGPALLRMTGRGVAHTSRRPHHSNPPQGAYWALFCAITPAPAIISAFFWQVGFVDGGPCCFRGAFERGTRRGKGTLLFFRRKSARSRGK